MGPRPLFVPRARWERARSRTYGHTALRFSQQTFLLRGLVARRYDACVPHPLAETATGVDWSQIHAVRLLGVALAALFLLWAIRRMFGGKK
jgi:hypothetical protein